jgi:uncharacterized protein with PQ loop repeat
MVFFMSCYIPQIVRTLRTKDVAGISIWLLIMVVGGYITGLIYVIWLVEPILILTYSVGLVVATSTMGLILYFKRK